MVYLDLFLGFLKVGCFSFGGAYAAIPLVRDVVLSHGWLSEEMLSYMIAVSESTPGPIMVNMATYVGTTQAGVLGALVATLAVVLPAFVIILVLTAVLYRIIDNQYVQAVLKGIMASMIGIILALGGFMIVENLTDARTVVLTAILAAVYFGIGRILKKKISPIMLIIIAAFLGIVAYYP